MESAVIKEEPEDPELANQKNGKLMALKYNGTRLLIAYLSPKFNQFNRPKQSKLHLIGRTMLFSCIAKTFGV